jgi:uncharacterized protein involved in type VI secretion and phage assembly
MTPVGLFPAPSLWFAGAHLAKVISVQDPQSLGRIQVQLLAADPDGSALVWARVVMPYAGDNYGAYLIPGIGEEVLVVFTGNDANQPVVIGALWNGKTAVPESLAGNKVDRWSLCGKNGTRIVIIEESNGSEAVSITTPNHGEITVTDSSGGEIYLSIGGNKIVMDTSGITIETSSKCSISASTVSVSASSVTVDAGMSKFSGVVQCDTLVANSVVSTSYTPGAGNVW